MFLQYAIHCQEQGVAADLFQVSMLTLKQHTSTSVDSLVGLQTWGTGLWLLLPCPNSMLQCWSSCNLDNRWAQRLCMGCVLDFSWLLSQLSCPSCVCHMNASSTYWKSCIGTRAAFQLCSSVIQPCTSQSYGQLSLGCSGIFT